MPLWIVLLILGAAGCGFLFLKARELEVKQTLKKVKAGHKDVREAARYLAKQPSGIVEQAPVTSEEEVNFSKDLPSSIAKDLKEIMRKGHI